MLLPILLHIKNFMNYMTFQVNIHVMLWSRVLLIGRYIVNTNQEDYNLSLKVYAI